MKEKRKKTFDETMDESNIRSDSDYLERKKRAETENNAPYKVTFVDQWHGHCEDGYTDIGEYPALAEAVKSADEITKEGRGTGPIEGWRGIGDAALVYDSKGNLVWDGIREYVIKDEREKLSRAVEFATGAHYGQFRKGTNIPYIVHPLGVAKILIENNCSNEAIIAGVLHDVLEDTKVTYDDLKESFGDKVAEIVKAVTEPDKSAPWSCRKRNTIECLKTAPWHVLLVACADKLDNIRAMRADYKKEGEDFWKRFNASKENQGWYYRSLAEVFSLYAKDSVFSILFRQFIKEVEAVFGKQGPPRNPSTDIGQLIVESQEWYRKNNLPFPD